MAFLCMVSVTHKLHNLHKPQDCFLLYCSLKLYELFCNFKTCVFSISLGTKTVVYHFKNSNLFLCSCITADYDVGVPSLRASSWAIHFNVYEERDSWLTECSCVSLLGRPSYLWKEFLKTWMMWKACCCINFPRTGVKEALKDRMVATLLHGGKFKYPQDF